MGDSTLASEEAWFLSKSFLIAGLVMMIPAIAQMYFFSITGFNCAARIR